MEESREDLRYPVGRFKPPAHVTAGQFRLWIDDVAELPTLLRRAVDGLNENQLDTPYRAGGWTVRQVVHHLPDSHINAYVRFRLSLTEDLPRIKPYEEARWAELEDARRAPVDESLALLTSLHARWVRLLLSMDDEDWHRAYDHPDSGPFPLSRALALYAWHGKHHVAHITSLREREGW